MRATFAIIAAGILGLLLIPAIALGQSTCKASKNTVTSVGTSAANVPATAFAKRRTILVCNSAENSGTPKVKCTTDNSTPVMGTANAGDVLEKGDCIPYNQGATDANGAATPVKCISDTAATAVHTNECR